MGVGFGFGLAVSLGELDYVGGSAGGVSHKDVPPFVMGCFNLCR